MKRSDINRKIAEGLTFLNKINFKLPPFAFWSPEDWQTKGIEYNEIRDCMLGWDITDFGSNDFNKIGLLVFTLRNGIKDSKEYQKRYAEKCLIIQEQQITPMHYHYNKMEDIINRGDFDLLVELYNSDDKNDLADTPVTVTIDGKRHEIPAGTIIRLRSGEGITIPPYLYHQFWADGGTTMAIEVSSVNDDNVDNRFYSVPSRFPEVIEDEVPVYLLFSEYPEFNKNNN